MLRFIGMLVFALSGCASQPKRGPLPHSPALAASNAPAKPDPIPILPPEWDAKVRGNPHFGKNMMLMQASLARLGYFMRPFTPELDERTIDAIEQYKHDAGLPRGESVIDRAFHERLQSDLDALVVPALPLHPFTFNDFGDTLFASGSWTGVGSKLAYPEQSTEIECRRALGVCFEAIAKLAEEHTVVGVQALVYEIERWTDTEVVFTGDRALCSYTTTRLNRVTKSVSRTRTTTNTDGACGDLATADVHLKLVSGTEIRDELFEDFVERQDRVFGFPVSGE